jgi:azurin
MKLGYIHEIKVTGVRSAENFSLLHNFGYYTLNQIPDGEKLAITNENRVEKMDHSKMDMGKGKTVKPVATSTVKHLTKQPADWTNGPGQTILLNPVPNLKFNTSTITVKAGTKVKLTFKNSDDMLHNVVITAPNAADEVGSAALKMGLNGERMSFVPVTNKVLFHTLLLQPGKSDTIYFTAPEKPGDYPYVCTYPGHYLVMRGILKVVAK